MFQFADKYRGSYSNGLKPFVCPFYCDFSGYQVIFIMPFLLQNFFFSLKINFRILILTILIYLLRMSCCGVLLGCIRLLRIQLTLTTFKLMDRPLEQMKVIIHLDGTISMLELEFFSPRSFFLFYYFLQQILWKICFILY